MPGAKCVFAVDGLPESRVHHFLHEKYELKHVFAQFFFAKNPTFLEYTQRLDCLVMQISQREK